MDVLKGIKVIEVGAFITGPCAAMMLADLGADVIKVEDPEGGDPFRSFQGSSYSPQFRAYNCSKRSVTLNLKDAAGQDLLRRLIADSDVLVENFRPGIADTLGFGWERMKAENPRLVYCSITGFGATGPYANQPCYDTVAQAQSGYLSQFADRDAPRIAGPAVADVMTGVHAAYGVLAALLGRATTGLGKRVEAAMLDTMIAISAEPFARYFATGTVADPWSRAHGSQSYAFTCSDGKLVAVHLSSPQKFWINLIAALGTPELERDPRYATRADRVENFHELNACLQKLFSMRTRDEWITRLRSKDVPHAPIANLDEVEHNPQVMHTRILERLHHPTEGEVRHIRRPFLMDGSRGDPSSAPPTLGEHTAQVLADLGLSQVDIERLRSESVI